VDTTEELGPSITVKEAARELNCSISLVYKLLDQGQIAYERRGRRKLPVARSVADFRRRNVVPADARPGSPRPVLASPGGFRHLFQKPRRRAAP
jgi:excisionase family DNA binding protein